MPDESTLPFLSEDIAARERALDVRTSFIVQAPAGSGKTELLIQRYLALLGGVDEPERIVALTFTRKAAGEMRARVLAALNEARAESPIGAPHAALTRRLARIALARSDRRGWSITDHPSRLRMLTFDALSASLARRAPLASGLGAALEPLDDAGVLYRAAADAAIAAADRDDSAWRRLLVHVDNDASRAAELVAGLLARRDQWLRQVGGMAPAQIRAGLEAALRDEAASVLRAVRDAFPPDLAGEVAALAREAALVLAGHEREERRVFADALDACAALRGLPEPSADAIAHWATLARFLMVKEGSHFRRKVDRDHGFPPAERRAAPDDRARRREAMLALCERLNAVPGLAASLHAAARLPPPKIGDDGWALVEALLALLPRAVATLNVVFTERRAVDYVQVGLAALDALGRPDAPSDLLLRLDARIEHLLIDEFQDTSFLQLLLIECLTAGWQASDGRTLFAVGDPMQSIYRFREAEVRLFVEAQARGSIAGVPVMPLTLRQNFRSQANLVDWVNGVFGQVLGRVSDLSRGAVAYAEGAAALPALAGVEVTAELGETIDDEARRVVARVREARERGACDVAILVRARSHLTQILPALRAAGIAFSAVDLDTLSQRQAMLDLCSLTYALTQPADRTAWLALLRAPWCGLVLADLFALVDLADGSGNASLLEALGDPGLPGRLSPDGRERVSRLRDAVAPALAARGRASLAARVRGAWLALGGPACLSDPLDIETAERYFDVLAVHERSGDLPDRAGFTAALSALYAAPDAGATTGVQVMTMHKAKGLQFDTVILAGLARRGPRPTHPLLRWRRREAGLLIAPSRPRGGEDDPLYNYLATVEAGEEDAELGRLLYVACTRARSHLHLIGAPGVDHARARGVLAWKRPPKASSLARLGDVVHGSVASPQAVPASDAALHEVAPPLKRLPLAHAPDPPASALSSPPSLEWIDDGMPPFDWVRETTRRIGTLAHRLLARLAEEDASRWTAERVAAFEPRVRAELASAGFDADELPRATATVLEAVRRTLADPRGRWLFDPAHAEARSEWALAGLDDGAIVHVVLDRTFVADGERWIVDFKTGTHEGADVAGFLANEAMRYRGQLQRYGRIVRGLDERPVRLALFYPLIEGGFIELASESGSESN